MRTVILVLLVALGGNASAQDPLADFRFKLEAQRLEIERQRSESIAKLKEAIINLRDARRKSCQFKSGPDCQLAELSSVELLLLEIEDSYRRGEGRTQSEPRRTNYKAVQEMTSNLRGKVSELAELIDKADR